MQCTHFIVAAAPYPYSTRISHQLRRCMLRSFSMALEAVETAIKVPPLDPIREAPEVAVTPCEGWPAPYYFEGGLRRVKAYHYTYNTNCKGRWRGRKLVDIFVSEFRDRSAEYYVWPACFMLACLLMKMTMMMYADSCVWNREKQSRQEW